MFVKPAAEINITFVRIVDSVSKERPEAWPGLVATGCEIPLDPIDFVFHQGTDQTVIVEASFLDLEGERRRQRGSTTIRVDLPD